MKEVIRYWYLPLILLCGAALVLRLYGLNYDQSHNFHPDERRIAEAVVHLSFRPLQLNPDFFAYGSLPFYLTRTVMSIPGWFDRWFLSYDAAIMLGRALSAFYGTLTVLVIGLLGRRLYGPAAGLTASLLLTFTVLHLQNSHFATNDILLTLLILCVLSVLIRAINSSRPLLWFGSAGALTGLAVATKFSALPVFLPIGVALTIHAFRRRSFRVFVGYGLLTTLLTVFFFSTSSPYTLLKFDRYWHDISEQSNMVRHAGELPFTNQYVGVLKYGYDVSQMVVWGMGLPLGLTVLGGAAWLTWGRRFRFRPEEWILLSWVVPFFLITGSFDVKFIRYLLPIYPLLILWGATALCAWADYSRLGLWARRFVVAATVLYALAFVSIYSRPHSVVTASNWFYHHVPKDSHVLIQDWDEGFPLSIPGYSSDAYHMENFGYYEPDGPEKIKKLSEAYARSDYLVFQTKRLYGAISQASEKFPLTNKTFVSLFAGDLGFTLVQDITSRPGLFGVEWPDELADESLSVYDHPKVLIFQNTGKLSARAIEDKILHGYPSRLVTRNEMLLASAHHSAATASLPESGPTGTWGSVGWLLAVWLLLTILSWIAYTLICRIFAPIQGLYPLTKVAGLLLLVYPPWIATSLKLVPLGHTVLLAWSLVLLGIGVVLWRQGRSPAWPHREGTLTEVIFGGTLLFFAVVRAAQPEIFWGEKPMDSAFLHVLYRTAQLPPPEPWYSGSPLHYTYFGHYWVTAIGRTLSVPTGVMYNVGIATGAALTAASVFAAGIALGRRLLTGVLAVIFVLGIGNLSGIFLIGKYPGFNFDYFWATTRILPIGINEYPFWSFLFADLHAHVLALPFTFSLLALLLLQLNGRSSLQGTRSQWITTGLWEALLLGAVMITNGWSTPVYTTLPILLLGLGLTTGPWTVRHVWENGLRPLGILALGAVTLYLPFWLNFHPPTRQWGWEHDAFTGVVPFLEINGFFLIALVPFALIALWRWLRIATPFSRTTAFLVWAGLFLVVSVSLFQGAALEKSHFHPATSIRGFTLLLGLICFSLFFFRKLSAELRWTMVLAAFACFIMTGCDYIHVWDRMNTVFKFYYESWGFLSLAAAGIITRLLIHRDLPPAWRIGWLGLIAAGLLLGLFTAWTGLYGLLQMRRVPGPSGTLDGMAYLPQYAPAEAAAITWLNQNIPGIPVLCEAQGPSYENFNRITMHTGLPVVLGWDYHVSQRGQPASGIEQRKQDIRTLYTTDSLQTAEEIVSRYHIALIYVGKLERETYNGANETRFRQWKDQFTPVYENEEVCIFAVPANYPGITPVNTIDQVAPAPEATTRPPSAPSAAPVGELSQPRSLVFDRDNTVYICDFGHKRMAVWDKAQHPLKAWGQEGNEAGEFADPCGITLGPDGNVYVADTWNHRVQVFSKKGNFLRQFTGNLFSPRGIAIASTGIVYIADSGNSRIVCFSPTGEIKAAWGKGGTAPGEFNEPIGLAVDSASCLYICDTANGRLQILDKTGAFVRQFPVPGWRSEIFSEPYIAIDSRKRLWVTVPKENEVRCYNDTGVLLKSVKTAADHRALNNPIGIAITSSGEIYVSDLNNRIVSLGKP